MPNYKEVTLHQDLNEIRDDVFAARKDGSYEGLVAEFDDVVLTTIQDGMELAKSNTLSHASDVESCRVKCKGKLDWVEGELAKKDLDVKDYIAIKASLALVKRYVDEMHVWRREFADKMAKGFRGGWPDVAKKIFSDAKLYAPFESKRKTMIDLDNKVSTMAARCDEYVSRAAELLKQVIQLEKSGKVDVAEFERDIADHLASMQAHATFIDDKILKARSALTYFDTLGKKKEKEYTKSDCDLGASLMATLERAAKECRGRLKTMTVEHDGLEKRAKAAGPGWKDLGLDAVKGSSKVCKGATTASADISDREAAARKLLGKVEKVVK